MSVDFARLDADYLALSILSDAKGVALAVLIEEVHACGQAFAAVETYRLVANAYDRVARAIRVNSGLEERGDPIMPTWILPPASTLVEVVR